MAGMSTVRYGYGIADQVQSCKENPVSIQLLEWNSRSVKL